MPRGSAILWSRPPRCHSHRHSARLIEGFSPKLGRRETLFDHTAFATWINL